MLNILVFMASSLLILTACQSSSVPDTAILTESGTVTTETSVPSAPTATTTTATTPAPTEAVPTATATPEILPTPTQPPQVSRVIEVDSKFAEFSPSTILVKPGEAVQFKVTSSDTNHTFTFEVDGKQVDLRFGRGETVTSEVFTFANGETITFWCAVPGHRGAGMEGTITTEASVSSTTPATGGNADSTSGSDDPY